ncbi:MAG: DNA/RNA non-specific endonuclease [Bacteroidales bacterium]|nr:DNA/RNA non-specific endonuclease [Bacteroidales bacterium]
MQISKTQRFGLITFFILIVAAYLVTTEPWKKSSGTLQTSLNPETPPMEIAIAWVNLTTGYPLASTVDTILSYSGFDLGYNEQYEQAAWVAYVLSREEIESGNIERTDNFRPDTAIASGSATLADYRGSGFDRGHLAPAGDMQWAPEAMSESLLMSNMSPQLPAFNRGVWLRLETEVRNWALEKDSIYVITGPVLAPIDSFIGENQVGIPQHYYKVLVDLSPPDHSLIAFLLPHSGSSDALIQFAITVDSLEQVTGYDFFATAPDQDMLEWLERQLDLDSWD